MEREKLESLIIDYIDNKLNAVDRQKVEQELVHNQEAYKLYEELKEVIHVMDRAAAYEPTQKLKANFQELLDREVVSSQPKKTIFFQPAFYRAAAAVALVVLGAGFGYWISKENAQQERLAAIEKQMESTKLMMMSMLENQQSASQRMQGVNVAHGIDKADEEIVRALVKVMNEDANSNVRLAALEALSRFRRDPSVKRMLVQSLSLQKDPVVQIALIQLLVSMQEKGIVNDLQRIVDDNETIRAVKDEAYSGILELS